MQLQDINTFIRYLVAEPSQSPQGRWQDADIAIFASQAQTQVALDLDWPESSYTGYTVANVQEYQMPEALKILRVYLAGQPIVPTTIPALQGDQLEIWDQSAPGNIPQWLYQQSQVYPFVSGTYGYNAFNAGNTPWCQNERPRFYIRGGNIGIVPKPVGAYFMQIDLIPQPPTLVNLTDVSIFQTTFKDAICWKCVEYMFFGDTNSLLNTAMQNYEKELGKLRSWKADYQKMLPRGVFPITSRTFFQGPIYKRMTSRSGC
jgi:hypothetical protein